MVADLSSMVGDDVRAQQAPFTWALTCGDLHHEHQEVDGGASISIIPRTDHGEPQGRVLAGPWEGSRECYSDPGYSVAFSNEMVVPSYCQGKMFTKWEVAVFQAFL